MKNLLTLATGLLLLYTAESQVSFKVKKTNSGGEVDLKTSGKTDNRSNNPQTPQSSNKNGTDGSVKGPVSDTTALPAGDNSGDAAYKGPAKVQLRSFWSHFEKVKNGTGTASSLNNAGRMIQMIREQDPAYDVAPLEALLKPYQEKAAKEASDKSAAKAAEDMKQSYFREFWNKLTNIYSKGIDIQPGVTGKTYYDRVKELNFEEYKQKRQDAGETGPNSYPVLIDNLLADYDAYVKRADRMKWNVVAPMTASRSAANPQEKTALLESARYECEAILYVSPGQTAFRQKLEEINKLLGAAGAEAARYFTSDFHKENLNRIVWSTQPLVIGKEKEMAGLIRSEFKTGEPIFGTAYLGVQAKEAMGPNTNLRVRIRVDGGTAIWGGDLSYFEIPLAVQDKSYIQFALIPDEQWLKNHYAPYLAEENWTISYFLDELAASGDISHQVTCELIFPTNKLSDIKSGLTLDLSAGSAGIKAMSEKLHDQLMASRTLPKAGMSNAALEQQMLAAANGLGWNDKFLKTIITSGSWTVVKNELTGAILYRVLGAVCTLKGNDGKCYYQEFGFRQDYTGGGNYDSKVKYNSYGGKREIGCDKIK